MCRAIAYRPLIIRANIWVYHNFKLSLSNQDLEAKSMAQQNDKESIDLRTSNGHRKQPSIVNEMSPKKILKEKSTILKITCEEEGSIWHSKVNHWLIDLLTYWKITAKSIHQTNTIKAQQKFKWPKILSSKVLPFNCSLSQKPSNNEKLSSNTLKRIEWSDRLGIRPSNRHNSLAWKSASRPWTSSLVSHLAISNWIPLQPLFLVLQRFYF